MMKNRLRWLAKRLLRLTGGGRGGRLEPATIRRVEYFVNGGIGDAVLARPAVSLLARSLPHARLEVFVPAAMHDMLLRVFDDCRVRKITAATCAVLLARRFFPRADVSFANTISAFRVGTEVLAWMSSRVSCGVRYPSESPAHRAYRVSAPMGDEHDLDQNLKLVAGVLGLPIDERDRWFPARSPSGPASTTVIVHPGAGRSYENKRWPAGNFRELAGRIVDTKHRVTVLLGPADHDLRPFFADVNGVDLLLDPSPDALIAALRGAVLFVGNDSGPAHLAAFYGANVIVLFGPADPGRAAPRGRATTVISAGVPCSPCHFTDARCLDNQCMKSITVEHVWEQTHRALRDA